jgi:hypothetical protein
MNPSPESADSFPGPSVTPAFLDWPPRRLTLFACYLFANLLGALLILAFGDAIVRSAIREERSIDSVDGVTFFCQAAPVFLVCGLINALWVIKVLIEVFKRRSYRALIALGIALAIWAVAVVAMRLDS